AEYLFTTETPYILNIHGIGSFCSTFLERAIQKGENTGPGIRCCRRVVLSVSTKSYLHTDNRVHHVINGGRKIRNPEDVTCPGITEVLVRERMLMLGESLHDHLR